MTNPETRCPNCQHDQHLPGTECGATVGHGPNRWHLCLCLARPGAALPCPPQMTCQGGTLGYSDVWYLQQGHSLSSADGVISPEVLGPVAVGFPTPDAAAPAAVSVPPPATRADDQAALRDRIADTLAAKFTSGAEHTQGMRVAFEGPDGWPATRMVTPIEAADAVLAVLPDPTDRAAFVAEAEAKLTAGCPDHGPNGGWLMTCQCEAIGVLRDLAAEAQTTTKPETAADRAALRRQFGDVLRHWGLLDEQIDQKAAEEYAVTDLLALLPEQTSRDAETEHLRDRLASCRERVGIAADKAIAAEDAIARARRARRRLTSALIAVEPLLAEPYPDDPRWTPWTRFVGPALKELSDALKTGPAANDEPPAAGVRQDGAQA